MRFLFPTLYVLFGLGVVGGYGASRAYGYDLGATSVQRQTLGAQYRRAGPSGAVYRPPPIFWYGGITGGK